MLPSIWRALENKGSSDRDFTSAGVRFLNSLISWEHMPNSAMTGSRVSPCHLCGRHLDFATSPPRFLSVLKVPEFTSLASVECDDDETVEAVQASAIVKQQDEEGDVAEDDGGEGEGVEEAEGAAAVGEGDDEGAEIDGEDDEGPALPLSPLVPCSAALLPSLPGSRGARLLSSPPGALLSALMRPLDGFREYRGGGGPVPPSGVSSPCAARACVARRPIILLGAGGPDGPSGAAAAAAAVAAAVAEGANGEIQDSEVVTMADLFAGGDDMTWRGAALPLSDTARRNIGRELARCTRDAAALHEQVCRSGCCGWGGSLATVYWGW